MGKGRNCGAGVAIVDAPECKALLSLLQMRVQEGDSTMATPPTLETASVYDAMTPPPINTRDYLARWTQYGHADLHVIVIAAIYIDRFMDNTGISLTSHNIHRVLLSALVTAAKLCEDLPFNNHHYSGVGGLSVQELGRIEMAFIENLKFELFVSKEDFTSTLLHLKQAAAYNPFPTFAMQQAAQPHYVRPASPQLPVAMPIASPVHAQPQPCASPVFMQAGVRTGSMSSTRSSSTGSISSVSSEDRLPGSKNVYAVAGCAGVLGGALSGCQSWLHQQRPLNVTPAMHHHSALYA